jgi:hypothetical protein
MDERPRVRREEKSRAIALIFGSLAKCRDHKKVDDWSLSVGFPKY